MFLTELSGSQHNFLCFLIIAPMTIKRYVADYTLHHATPPWQRRLLWLAGVLSLVFAAIGVVLPGLPTTPFVLLAAGCFVRASPRAHAWLLRSHTFGPLIREWEQHRSIPRRVKRFALLTMLLTGAVSLGFLAGQAWLQLAVLGGMSLGGVMVWRLPTRHE